MSQWQNYDELFNDLSKWLKNFETKLKQEAGPRTDLPAKQNQLDVIKVMMTVYCRTQSCILCFFFDYQTVFVFASITVSLLFLMIEDAEIV